MHPEAMKHEFLVKKWLQLRYILYFLGVLAGGGGILGVVLYRRLHTDLRFAMFQGHSRLVSPWDAVGRHVVSINLVALALVLLASLALTLALSYTIATAARTLHRNILDYLEGVEPEHWRPLRHPRELRHLQWLLANGLEAHRKHVARVRLACEELKHELGETRERMLRDGVVPDHARLRAVHRRLHEDHAGYRFFKLS